MKRHAVQKIVIFSLLLHLCLHAGAQALQGYTKRLWSIQDGLPEQTVQAFAQTPDHYLWIGTTGGLLRFDGAHFDVFDRENTPALKETSVFCLLAAHDGTLWIGTEGGGLLRYRAGTFQAYSIKDGLSDDFVRALYEDHAHTLWIGTDNGLLKFSQGRIVRVDNTPKIPRLAVHAIYEDHRGDLWVGGSRLLEIHQNHVQEYDLRPEGTQNRVKSILETRDGTMWVGTVSGLYKLQSEKKTFSRIPEINVTVRALRQTKDGALWVGTIGRGILILNAGKYIHILAPDTLPSNTILNFYEDDERNLWIGTQAGMLRLTKTSVGIIPLPDATDSDFGTIARDKDGTLWVASTHLYQIRNNVAHLYRFPELHGAKVRDVFRTHNGTLWVGTDGDGAFQIEKGKARQYTTRNGLVNNFIRVFQESKDGSIWIGADEGVSHVLPNQIVNYKMSDGLCYFSIRDLIEAKDGDVWIGTDRGLSHLHQGVFVQDEATRSLAQEQVWTIHEDTDGGIWFGTRNDGLFRWKSKKITHYTTQQGLASNSIYKILEDAKNHFWISGPNGISLLNRRELDAISHTQHLPITLYRVSDEIDTTQLYGGRQPSGCISPSGDVWFPSTKGVVQISLDEAVPSPLPTLVIRRIFADGRSLPILSPVTLAPGNGRLEIDYAPVLLRSQDRVSFRYEMRGFDKHWTETTLGRAAAYTNLPPGHYTFEVEAFEIDNPQKISTVSLQIIQTPHFYATYWFLAICVFSVAGIILANYRFHLRQVKQRFRAVLEERGRLAREMHDTVIQGCTSVSALLEAISSLGFGDKSIRQELVNCACTQVRKTIDEARQAIWNLRREDVSEGTLETLMQTMSDRISEEFNIRVECSIFGKIYPLNHTTTHELLMVTREALYNAIRHGKSTVVNVQIKFEKDYLSINVIDDGCGFDSAAVYSQPDRHYGVIGMKERIARVGGEINIYSTPGKGTVLHVKVSRKASSVQDLELQA